MLTLLLIGGWADGRFTEWLLRGAGRPEALAAACALVLLIGLWRMALRNEREHGALTPARGRGEGALPSEED